MSLGAVLPIVLVIGGGSFYGTGYYSGGARRRAAIQGEEAHAEQALRACRPSRSPIKWRA
jgi:hypothetical protein